MIRFICPIKATYLTALATQAKIHSHHTYAHFNRHLLLPQLCSQKVTLGRVLWALQQHLKEYHLFGDSQMRSHTRSNFGTKALSVWTISRCLCAIVSNKQINCQLSSYLNNVSYYCRLPCISSCLEYPTDLDRRQLFSCFVGSLCTLVWWSVNPLTSIMVLPEWPILPFAFYSVRNLIRNCL